jgi:hypothetical protein
MKLTRHEIVLLAALALALITGALVKQFRASHPVQIAPATPKSKK